VQILIVTFWTEKIKPLARSDPSFVTRAGFEPAHDRTKTYCLTAWLPGNLIILALLKEQELLQEEGFALQNLPFFELLFGYFLL
jgi:hypothetical protein